jgi:hypothetical protein
VSSVLAWLAVWCLATGWLVLVNFFLPPDGRGWAFAGAGVLLAMLAAHRVRWQRIDPWLYLPVPALIVAAWLWPWPYRAGPLMLLAGLFFALPLRRATRLTPLALGLLLAGAAWTAQGGATVAYWWLGARYHQAPFLTPILFALARLLGWSGGSSGGSLFLPHIEGPFPATTTWERLGVFPAMLLAAGGAALLPLVERRSARALTGRLLAAAALGAGYLALRYLALTAAVAIRREPAAFWLPLPTALTFLPLSLVLARALPLRGSPPEPAGRAGKEHLSRYAALAALTFAAALAAVGVLSFPDPGRQKAGRVLLDEYQSNWEWTTQVLDTDWYGQKSGYNYYSLGQWLRHYYQVDTNLQPRTAQLLRDYDVLIIKTPTAPFSPEEIDAIEAWVEAGGGLFLIGDHTNVFGTSSYLNPLARRFGLRFRYDSTYDLATLRVTLFQPPGLLAHPVVVNMPPFLFATSCTLEAPLLADSVMAGYGLRALPVDYAQRVFFPDKEAERDYPFGLFLQSAAVRHGRGRVVAFTDSTVFSNFSMFLAGKPEYFLGAMNWLNRSQRWPWLDGVLAAAGLLATGGALWLARSLDRLRAWAVVISALVLATAIGPWACHQVATASYRLPEPHSEITDIAFEGEHSGLFLPTTPAANPPEASFQTFYVWTQRLGYVPSYSATLEEALAQASLLVVVNPVRPFTAEEVAAVADYVSQGGRLLVLAEPRADPEAARPAEQILAPFGLGVEARQAATGAVHNAGGEAVGSLTVGGVTRGGEPLLSLGGRAPVVAATRHGEGLVVVTAFARPFSDRSMGSTAVVPNAEQRFLFEVEFWLLRGLVDGTFPPLQTPGEGG